MTKAKKAAPKAKTPAPAPTPETEEIQEETKKPTERILKRAIAIPGLGRVVAGSPVTKVMEDLWSEHWKKNGGKELRSIDWYC